MGALPPRTAASGPLSSWTRRQDPPRRDGIVRRLRGDGFGRRRAARRGAQLLASSATASSSIYSSGARRRSRSASRPISKSGLVLRKRLSRGSAASFRSAPRSSRGWTRVLHRPWRVGLAVTRPCIAAFRAPCRAWTSGHGGKVEAMTRPWDGPSTGQPRTSGCPAASAHGGRDRAERTAPDAHRIPMTNGSPCGRCDRRRVDPRAAPGRVLFGEIMRAARQPKGGKKTFFGGGPIAGRDRLKVGAELAVRYLWRAALRSSPCRRIDCPWACAVKSRFFGLDGTRTLFASPTGAPGPLAACAQARTIQNLACCRPAEQAFPAPYTSCPASRAAP